MTPTSTPPLFSAMFPQPSFPTVQLSQPLAMWQPLVEIPAKVASEIAGWAQLVDPSGKTLSRLAGVSKSFTSIAQEMLFSRLTLHPRDPAHRDRSTMSIKTLRRLFMAIADSTLNASSGSKNLADLVQHLHISIGDPEFNKLLKVLVPLLTELETISIGFTEAVRCHGLYPLIKAAASRPHFKSLTICGIFRPDDFIALLPERLNTLSVPGSFRMNHASEWMPPSSFVEVVVDTLDYQYRSSTFGADLYPLVELALLKRLMCKVEIDGEDYCPMDPSYFRNRNDDGYSVVPRLSHTPLIRSLSLLLEVRGGRDASNATEWLCKHLRKWKKDTPDLQELDVVIQLIEDSNYASMIEDDPRRVRIAFASADLSQLDGLFANPDCRPQNLSKVSIRVIDPLPSADHVNLDDFMERIEDYMPRTRALSAQGKMVFEYQYSCPTMSSTLSLAASQSPQTHGFPSSQASAASFEDSNRRELLTKFVTLLGGNLDKDDPMDIEVPQSSYD